MFDSTVRLPITGFGGGPVPNQFLRQSEAAGELAIFFPGMGYSCDMPLFYYTQNWIEERGADLLRLEFDYGHRNEFRELPWDQQLEWLAEDSTAGVLAVLEQRTYSQITLIGKSLGVYAISRLLQRENQLMSRTVRIVWLTPALVDAVVYSQIQRFGQRSLVIIGTDDPGYDAELMAELRIGGLAADLVIDGADHGLDIVENVLGSIDVTLKTIQTIIKFLSPETPDATNELGN